MRHFIIVLCFSWCVTALASPQLTRLDGKSFDLSQFQGKWVMINYWATWCGPCLDEISEFNRLIKEYKDSVVVFGVNYDMVSKEEQNTLVRRYRLHYPSLLGNPAKALRLGDIRGVPVTFIFDPQGKLHDTLHGGQSYENLVKAIGK